MSIIKPTIDTLNYTIENSLGAIEIYETSLLNTINLERKRLYWGLMKREYKRLKRTRFKLLKMKKFDTMEFEDW